MFIELKIINCTGNYFNTTLSDKIHKTNGIVLRTVKYGETSIVATVYTELFGLQPYILNGVRTLSKKGSNKMVFFQPGTLLEMEVYHNELKQLNRVKEYRWAFLYKTIFSDVVKNGVAMYMVELLTKCLTQPEENTGLYAFVEDCLIELDSCNEKEMANFPIFFGLHLSRFFGFLPEGVSRELWKKETFFFDVENGRFAKEQALHHHCLNKNQSKILAEILLVRQTKELSEINANVEMRRSILEALAQYYNMHITGFGKMKTLPILKEIIN